MRVYSIEKAEFWRKKVIMQSNSGMYVKQFCRLNNLGLDQFKYWRDRFTNENSDELIEIKASSKGRKSPAQSLTTSLKGRFLPVCIQDENHKDRTRSFSPVYSSQSGLSISIGNSARLEIDKDFDSLTLGRVLEVISGL